MFLSLLLTDLKRYLPFAQEGHHTHHRGAMEDQGPGGKGCRHPSLQNTNTEQGDIAGRRDHEGWVPS